MSTKDLEDYDTKRAGPPLHVTYHSFTEITDKVDKNTSDPGKIYRESILVFVHAVPGHIDARNHAKKTFMRLSVLACYIDNRIVIIVT